MEYPGRVNISTMSKVLVTGGAGFIGSHLAKVLLDKFRVIVIDIKINPKSSGFHIALGDLYQVTERLK